MKKTDKKQHWFPTYAFHKNGFVFSLAFHWHSDPTHRIKTFRGWDAALGLGFVSLYLGYRKNPK